MAVGQDGSIDKRAANFAAGVQGRPMSTGYVGGAELAPIHC